MSSYSIDPFGERAGLVETDDVDAGEALDRRQLLHEHVAAGQGDRRDREREARQQHEAFGHHRDDTGDHARHRLPPAFVRAELAEREQRRGRQQRPRHVAQDRVDAVHQLGPHEREPPRLGREPARVRVGADAGRLEPSRARDHDAAREHLLIAWSLSTGSDSPVSSDSSISSPSAVTTTPSAGTWSPARNTTRSSTDDLLDRDLALGAVADDGRASAR